MKKIFTLLVCMTLLLSAVTVAGAASCTHIYTGTKVSATCVSRGYTQYTCVKCGDTYKEYASLYTAPQEFYTLLEADRDGDTLNVTVSMGNNPGLWASRLTLRYSSVALEPVSAANGNIWTSGAIVTTNTDSSYIRFYCQNTTDGDNTNNGTVFTASFKILDPMAENWGLRLTYTKGDNASYTNGAQVFTLIDTVTSGYGDHTYDEGKVTVSPTVDKHGTMLYTCTLCGETKTESIERLTPYVKGDVDGDGEVTMLDLYKLKLFLKQQADPGADEINAGDIDGDGDITMIDSYEIKYRVANGSWR